MLMPITSSQRRRNIADRRLQFECLEERSLLSTVVALTDDARLLKFDASSPGQILTATPITGLQAGESLLGIDVRPATAQLYGLGSAQRLYVIDPNSGVATLKATLAADPTDAT